MTKNKVVIWGASGHAKVIADIIRLANEYELVGFLDDFNTEKYNTAFCGATILGGREQLGKLHQEGVNKIIMGFGDCAARLQLAKEAKKAGFSMVNAIHPMSVIASGVKMGKGVVVAALAVINPDTEIGDNVIVNTAASIDHDCVIGEGTHICPGVNLAGNVTVGRGSWVGIGSNVKDNISIGADTVIGAGSVVVKNIPARVTAYGVPAQVIIKEDKK